MRAPRHPVRVVVISATESGRASSSAMVRASGHRVELAASAGAVLGALDATCVDVVVVDLGTVPPTQLDSAQFVAGALRSPLLALGGPSDDRVSALDSGEVLAAVGPVEPDELGAQIASWARWGRAVARLGADHLQRERHAVSAGPPDLGDGRPSAFTDLEWRLFCLLRAESGRYFDARQILELVWGYTFGSVSTVSVHVHRLRKKLAAVDGRSLGTIHTVRGRGYAHVWLRDREPPAQEVIDLTDWSTRQLGVGDQVHASTTR